MRSIYAIIVLSDTVASSASVGAPGFKYPHDYKWCKELGVHFADGRFFNLSIPEEAAEYNKICMNAFRAYHKWHYPVPRVLTPDEAAMLGLPLMLEMPVMESGFDEPAPAYTPPPPPEPVTQPDPIASHQARKEAHKLGIDLATVKGSGVGGLISKDDVMRAWHAQDGGAAPTTEGQGQISMAALMGAN